MGDAGFKHIAVNAAEEDDFVITAGAVEQAGEDAEASLDPAVEAPVEEGEVAGQATAASEQAEAAVPADDVTEAQEASEPAAEQPDSATERTERKTAKRPRPDDGYRETTLEDLKGEKMSTTQRVVIIAAIICIIGAVVYYLAFMR